MQRNSNFKKPIQNRLMLFSNCAIYGKKKTTFVKNQELLRACFEQ